MKKMGEWTIREAVEQVHKAAGLTHNHLRSHMACGIYYFMVKSILDNSESQHSLQEMLSME